MGLLGRLFGSPTATAEKIEKAYARGEWAEVIALAGRLDPAEASEDGSQLSDLVRDAGDRLARFNLDQAEACLRAGETERAAEHLELARAQTADETLLTAAREAAERLGATGPRSPATAAASCHDCSPGHAATERGGEGENGVPPDLEQAWELTLAALPESWASRYASLRQAERAAVLAAHHGETTEAWAAFEDLERAGHHEVLRYELAALHLREGAVDDGTELLQALLEECPEHELALQLAVDLISQGVELPWLQRRLEQNLEMAILPGTSHAGLAKLAARDGNAAGLVDHTRLAIENGHVDPQLLVWSACNLETTGQLDAAEAMLRRLSGGGCGGGADPLLAEFWLRQQRHPDQALDSFKHAARRDPENPRWALRIAQTYLLKGWKKEAVAMLTQIQRTPDLDSELEKEAARAIAQARS